MKLFLLSFFIFFTNFNLLIAQNTVFIGENSYDATPPIYFSKNNSIHVNNSIFQSDEPVEFTLTIAKTENSAILVLSVVAYNERNHVQGNIMLYLDDKTVLTCKNKNQFDHVNDISTATFILTTTQLDKLKVSNIKQIRYKIDCGNGCISSEEGTFLVKNCGEKGNSMVGEHDCTGTYLTDIPSLVKELFP